MSGVGKGVASASIGKILQSRGLEVTSIKIDPYVNVDAGTMNPTEHGEVFVLDDGTECDQDMGNYERFLDRDLSGANYMTTGSIYKAVIERERRMEYGGKCVEVVPHIPLEVIDRIEPRRGEGESGPRDHGDRRHGRRIPEYSFSGSDPHAADRASGGRAARARELSADYERRERAEDEADTVRGALAEFRGLQPDIILARAKHPLDEKRKEKIAFNCNLAREGHHFRAGRVELIRRADQF